MKRQEFIDNITQFYELRDFCHEHELWEITDEYFDGDQLDDEIERDISDRDCDWSTLRDYLNDISTGGEFYYRDGWLCYTERDDEDFQNLKNQVLDAMDEEEGWESSEPEENARMQLDDVWFAA